MKVASKSTVSILPVELLVFSPPFESLINMFPPFQLTSIPLLFTERESERKCCTWSARPRFCQQFPHLLVENKPHFYSFQKMETQKPMVDLSQLEYATKGDLSHHDHHPHHGSTVSRFFWPGKKGNSPDSGQ